jgi:hypothetical protein
MIVATNQPYFAPYPGFFQKMQLSDVMVILDSVQFPRGTTWITRNRFKNDQGTLWMTIPVWKKGLGLQKINQVQIYKEGHWRYKHLKSILTAYGHAPYLPDHESWLETIFSARFKRIVDMNLKIIHHMKNFLQIETELILVSTLGIAAQGLPLLAGVCKKLGASTYLAQTGAKKYLDKDLFNGYGIQLKYFKPVTPVYPQLWGDFIPDLSTLDVIFNCGAMARDLVRSESF